MNPSSPQLPPKPQNADPAELAKFGKFAHHWWDPDSEMFGPLHKLDPLRVAWIDRLAGGVAGKRVLDVGCGGGILSESLAARGAQVLGIDLSDKALGVAKLHKLESGAKVDYRNVAAEDLAAEQPGAFDVVTCMEMLEHVPDPGSIVRACATLARPGGLVAFSTINRNPKSYLLAILGAEYVLNLLPRGTHDWSRFLRPAELGALARQAGLALAEIGGVAYNPFAKSFRLTDDADVNYLIAFRKP
jgi:2-polyprenyl-6-hydroxyphenyl methylase / 3-demethylubiquinone-9 3-methyltransferase